MQTGNRPLFVFEMANNHMGDVAHGIKIVEEFAKIIEGISEFDFSVKLQHRHESFIHPGHRNRQDHKLIKRFVDTQLTKSDFKRLKEEIQRYGFISMCTPWDELSVDLMEELDFDIIKIASCSFNDWSLLERIAKTKKRIIASTAGASLDVIDQVVSFFSHRQKDFALMHCVGEYPCLRENLELNQIDLFHERYPGIPIGFSTHEDPENYDSIRIAVAKGAVIFEKHIGVPTERYKLNAYSATPGQAKMWLESAMDALKMCGVQGRRKNFTPKEIYDLGILHRGAYAARDLNNGDKLDENSYFLAMPNIDGQIVANDLSKYTEFYAQKDYKKGEVLMRDEFSIKELRKQVKNIVAQLDEILKESKVALPPYVDLEISYHYGIEKFAESGAVLVKVINREYSKILLIMFPGQSYPDHRHIKKDESYHILYGDLTVNLEGVVHQLSRGKVMSVNRGLLHGFTTKSGVIIEEIATTYIEGDSLYEDDSINKRKNRKTFLTFWPEWTS